jgi:transposase
VRENPVYALISTRAKLLLAVARGDDYQTAAHSVGRRSGDAVSQLVTRFNAEGTATLMPRHGGGRMPVYDQADVGRILAEVERTPTPEADGTATWSLSTSRTALRPAPEGRPTISTYTRWRVLHEAGYRSQRTRSWGPTGTALRRRKVGATVITDPDASPKKARVAKPP